MSFMYFVQLNSQLATFISDNLLHEAIFIAVTERLWLLQDTTSVYTIINENSLKLTNEDKLKYGIKVFQSMSKIIKNPIINSLSDMILDSDLEAQMNSQMESDEVNNSKIKKKLANGDYRSIDINEEGDHLIDSIMNDGIELLKTTNNQSVTQNNRQHEDDDEEMLSPTEDQILLPNKPSNDNDNLPETDISMNIINLQENELNLCIVCYNEKINSILLECGHSVLCWQCAQVCAQKHPRLCPVCRQAIIQIAHLTTLPFDIGDNRIIAISDEGYTIKTRPVNARIYQMQAALNGH